ncbi:MAG: alanine--tRNA ligase [Planctomycetota bacterium]|nr:alanine--tRNA ligase [Planctomycetota bacterium]
MRVAQIRSQFLEFFATKGHEVVPSSPVVPHDDPTLLFANAGMNQFKSVFTGEESRDSTRASSSQKCIRAGGKHNDLENVGYTARHLTFFEMLGNFSFGDYFKEEACVWAWELITEKFGIDADRMWISVYHEDDDARAIWADRVGVPADRIVRLGEKENFWSMGDVGPCGPCSELHVDRGEKESCGPNCALGVCDCDRWMEIWNLVFMQFEQQPGGGRIALPRPSIDTGMGLERITMVLQQKNTVFETDLLAGIIEQIGEVTGVAPSSGPEGTPHRVISDHLRSLSFAIADGAFPSNEERGYVLRRILRRASRYGYKLGMERPFIHQLVGHLVSEMGDAFPELIERQPLIEKLVHSEEEQFLRTLKTGMTRFDEEVARIETGDGQQFPSTAAFFLHDSCGFPIDLTEQMAKEVDLAVDRDGFDLLMDEQRTRSRAGSKVLAVSSGSSSEGSRIDGAGATEFVGYQSGQAEATVNTLFSAGDHSVLVLDRTPFYAESGGQVADTGTIDGEGFQLEVLDCQKNADGTFLHAVRLVEGEPAQVRSGMSVHCNVDTIRRQHVVRNHTATHLLHAALRQVIGDHVQQKGSLVSPERLRFDISHYEKIQPEALAEVEQRVQEWVLRDVELTIHDGIPIEEAKARGAMALFGEKYGDRVRLVEVPEISLELCGGIHCQRTGEIGPMIIVHEGSVSSGVRRIEALTGVGGASRTRADEDLLHDLSLLLRVPREDLHDRIGSLVRENRSLKDGKGSAPSKNLLSDLDAGHGETRTAGSAEVVIATWQDAPQEQLLQVADALKRRGGNRAFILVSSGNDEIRFIVGTSESLPSGTVHAGKVAQLGAGILGGGGGGRPDMAQAGGKAVDRLPEAIDQMSRSLEDSLAGKGA